MGATAGLQPARNYWWLLLIRGIVTVLFGIAALLWPSLTLAFFIYLFGAFAFIEGVVAIAAAVQERQTYKNWWVLLLEGIAGIILGVIVFVWPGITSLVLFYLIAIWALVTGFLAIGMAFSRYTPPGLDWTLVVSGIVLIILGLIMAAHPVVSILSLVWLIGLAAIVYGALLFVRAFQFRSLLERTPEPVIESNTPWRDGRL